MNLSIRELNELIYCIGITRKHGGLLGTKVADELEIKLRNELDKQLQPDYITSDSLIDKLNKAAARYSDEVKAKHIHIEEDAFTKVLKSNSHFVSNEEADEDYRSTLAQDSKRYEVNKKEKGWITQAILDYVDNTGASSYKELNEFYRFITGGSNSFSHHVYNLITPYKNRPTRRYLIKNAAGKYEVRVANESNWVVVDSNYRTFNEAPYGR